MTSAAILSIGDELTLGQSLDTNSQWIADQLVMHAIVTHELRTVDDDRVRIAAAIRELAAAHDLLLLTGGLGPTDDDVTREALGDVIAPGEPLVVDPEAQRALAVRRRRYQRQARAGDSVLPANNDRQAMRPAEARCLPNPQGTAPGLAATHGGCAIFLLPGPPREMKPMFEEEVAPTLQSGTDFSIQTAMVHCFGLGESQAAAMLGDLTARHDGTDRPLVGTTAGSAIVTARIRMQGAPETIASMIDRCSAQVTQAWGPYCFGSGDDTLAAAVGRALLERNLTISTAESCTGGLVGDYLVSTPGSSGYYLGGVVTYSNALKMSLLGVTQETLDECGAVSAEVVAAMVRGVQRQTGSDVAVAITGVAGPDGGTAEKPVGTVWSACVVRDSTPDIRCFRFTGDRAVIRDRAAKAALQMARFALLGFGDHPLLWEVDQNDQATRAAIALGSNLGDRHRHMAAAIEALAAHADIEVISQSGVREFPAVGDFADDAPPFLNATAIVETRLAAADLLAELLRIEQQAGRERAGDDRHTSRTLDLDLLFYGDAVIDRPGLQVPHPRLIDRAFVLLPLAEIAADWIHPVDGRSIANLAAALEVGSGMEQLPPPG